MFERITFLFRKGDKASKTAVWLGSIMALNISFMGVVLWRIAQLPDELFIDALVGGGAYFALSQFLTGMLYHKGKQLNVQENGWHGLASTKEEDNEGI